MKIALINDVHVGGRSDSEDIARHQARFFSDQFFPYLKKNSIKNIMILGDLFERRKFINFKTLAHGKESLFDPASRMDVHVDVLLGNHDCYHGNTNELNAPALLLKSYPNVTLLDAHTPSELEIGGTHIGLVPWMSSVNWDDCIDFIRNSRVKYLFGHFDINGFEMAPGHFCTKGMEQSMFDKYDMVLSGHYHKKASVGNIHYLGTQYDMDWSDYGNPKGFHVFDTESGELEFIENPNKIFTKIYWNDGTETSAESCSGKFTKLVVESRGDEYLYQQFVEKLLSNNPIDLKIVESAIAVESQTEEDVRLLSTLELMNKFVSTIEAEDSEKQRATEILASLYSEVVSSASV